MQKKLIVLALAGLASSAAFAQTNVTIYGVIDEYVGYGSASQSTYINPATGLVVPGSGGNQKFSGLQQGGLSGSRLGFKGEEALGNGLKAIFVYEFGSLDPGADTNNIGNTRQAYVGLTGGWGTAIGGKLQTPGYDAAVKFDPLAAAVFSPQLLLSTNAGMTIQGSSQGRVPNTIAYVSPNFSGFTGEVVYSFGEQTTGSNFGCSTAPTTPVTLAGGCYDKAQSVFGLGLNYDNGPFAASLVYHGIYNAGGTKNLALGSAPELKQTEYQVGLSYDFKMVKLFGSYQYLKQENFAVLGGGIPYLPPTLGLTGASLGTWSTAGILGQGNSVAGNQWSLGGGIPVGADGKVNLAYSYYSNNLGKNLFLGLVDNQKAQSFGIDYEYSLSKRTTAYAGYNYLNNGNSTNYGYQQGNVKVVPGINDNAWMIGAGVRHTF